MGSWERVVKAGKVIEVKRYYANRTGHHEKRGKKVKPSAESVKKANRRRREENLRWLMNANFRDGTDALVTFSFEKGEKQPEGYEGMKAEAQRLIRRIRSAYKDHGIDAKYIYCMEIGPRGSRHIHMVLSNAGELPPILLQSCWGHGVVDIKPLNTQGQYAKIAAYFVKYDEKSSETTGQKLGRSYNGSRNLNKPVMVKKPIQGRKILEDPIIPKGYYLDKCSIREGVTELTGRPFREFTFLRLDSVPYKSNIDTKTMRLTEQVSKCGKNRSDVEFNMQIASEKKKRNRTQRKIVQKSHSNVELRGFSPLGIGAITEHMLEGVEHMLEKAAEGVRRRRQSRK